MADSIVQLTVADAGELQAISRETFLDTLARIILMTIWTGTSTTN